MNKKTILISVGIILFLSIGQFYVRPLMHKKEAKEIVQKVLVLWMQEDLGKASNFWETPETSPPVYNLTQYNILKTNFIKGSKKIEAEVFATLEFPEENVLPSNKNWIFTVGYTKYGWKILDCKMIE